MKVACLSIMVFVSSMTVAAEEASSPAPDQPKAQELQTQPISPPPKSIEPERSNASSSNHSGVRFSAFAYMSAAKNLEFDDVVATSGGLSETGSIKFGMDSSYGLGVEWGTHEKWSWGWAAGLCYELTRDIKTFRSESAGVVTSGTYASPRPKLTLLIPYFNAVYRWDRFYMPFGINWSIPEFKKGEGATGSVSTNGTYGAQLGFGYSFSDRVSAELVSRVIQIEQKMDTSGVNYDLGVGKLTGLQVGIRIGF